MLGGLKPGRSKASRTSMRMATPATMVGARSGWRPRTRRGRRGGGPARRARRRRRSSGRGDSRGRGPGRRARGPGRSRRRRWPSRPRRSPDGEAALVVGDVAVDQAADVGAELGDLGPGRGIVAEVALGLADDAGLEGDVKAASRPVPRTSSVDPPPMSSTRVGAGSSGSRSLVAPRKVSRASSSPGIRRARGGSGRRRGRRTRGRWRRRGRRWSGRRWRSRSRRRRSAWRTRRGRGRRGRSPPLEAAVGVDAAPSRVDRGLAAALEDPPVGADVGDQQAGRVGPDVDHGDTSDCRGVGIGAVHLWRSSRPGGGLTPGCGESCRPGRSWRGLLSCEFRRRGVEQSGSSSGS